MINIDMEKARNIHRDHIRAARGGILLDLDKEYMVELERGPNGKAAEVAAKKQALRDAPADPRIDQAQTPDELKAVWDEDLLGPPIRRLLRGTQPNELPN